MKALKRTLIIFGIILFVAQFMAVLIPVACNVVNAEEPFLNDSTVVSASMAPTLQQGDVEWQIRLSEEDKDNLQVGDVIVFNYHVTRPMRAIRYEETVDVKPGDILHVSHRIIEVHDDYVVTKGDNNPNADPPVLKEDILRKALFHVPYGRILTAVTGISSNNAFSYITVFIIFVALAFVVSGIMIHER